MTRLLTFALMCVMVVPMNAQTLYDHLNDRLLIVEKVDRAIERGKIQESAVLYESDEDDEDYWFSGHTTVTLWQTNEGWIKIRTLHEFGGSGYEVKELYLTPQYVPVIAMDESKHEFRKAFIFENDEPAIYAEAQWDADELEFGDYTIYRITPKEYRYAAQILSQYEHVLQDWVKQVQRKQNKRRVGEYALGGQDAMRVQPQNQQPQANPEQELKQAAGALLIQSLDQALQKWLK